MIDHDLINVDHGMHHNLGFAQVRGALGTGSGAAIIEEDRTDGVSWLGPGGTWASGDHALHIDSSAWTAFGLLDWQFGSDYAPGLYAFIVADNQDNVFLVEDENGDNYLRIRTTNGAEEIHFGNPTTDPDFIFEGDGFLMGVDGSASAGADLRLRGGNGQGTNQNGGELELHGGAPTGSGGPGPITFYVSPPGASGTTLRPTEVIAQFAAASNLRQMSLVGPLLSSLATIMETNESGPITSGSTFVLDTIPDNTIPLFLICEITTTIVGPASVSVVLDPAGLNDTQGTFGALTAGQEIVVPIAEASGLMLANKSGGALDITLVAAGGNFSAGAVRTTIVRMGGTGYV